MTKHLRLTNDQFLHLHHTLSNSEFKVYLFLLTIDPFCDQILEIDTALIAERLGISRRTVQHCLHKLSESQLINWEVTRAKVQIFAPKSDKISAQTDNTSAQTNDTSAQTIARRRKQTTLRRNPLRERDLKPAQEADSGTSQPIQPISTSLNLSQCARENFGEEGLENFENADQENSGEEQQVESVKAISEQTQNKIGFGGQTQNNDDDQNSAAAPPRFFKNLRDFVVYEAKQDPKINAPEIWADTVIRRNPTDWQEKWDTWEKSRTQTVIGLPEKVEIDFEKSRRAMEEARKLLPAWMRLNRG